jgi:hypothetical protein
MAGVKISVLPSGGELQNNDLIPVARGASTFNVRGDVIFPVTEVKMGNNSVSNRTLSANVVSLDKIRTIPGNRVLGNSTGSQGNVTAVQVLEGMIADDSVTSVKIKEGEVKDANILNNTITLGKLQQISANRVLGATVLGNVVQTQVVEGMIANDAVTSAKIKELEVKTANIADAAVNRNKIAANEVMFANIQQIGGITNSVMGYTTANTNVQALKIVGDMIANSTITSDKLAAGVGQMPSGGIIMWSGATNNIPAGWALCNGSNGTPNLMDRFIIGAGSSYATGATGGSASHSHTATGGAVQNHTLNISQIPAHAHGISDPGHTHGVAGYAGIGGGNRINSAVICCGASDRTTSSTTGISVNNAGGTQAHTHGFTQPTISSITTIPPYYALAFIMKL